MNDYQKYLFEIFKDFRPSPKYPIYPPYHKGLYLEDYFINFYSKNNLNTERFLLD
jgi:hypothetical protein